jgi:hypothetical protein
MININKAMMDINVEEVLKGLSLLEGSNGYVIFNTEGIKR